MSHAHTDQDVIDVPDDDYVFLAVSAGNYETADRAFWTLKNVYGDRELTDAEARHLAVLRQRRRDAYADLVTWINTCEAQRIHRQTSAQIGARLSAGIRTALDQRMVSEQVRDVSVPGVASALREELRKGRR